MTVLLGWASGEPWMYIWVGALMAFAASTIGMLRLDEYRARRRVENKLTFSQTRFVKHIQDPGYGLGFEVNSRADFPIEFEVELLRTQLGNMVPDGRPTRVRRVLVPAGGRGWWNDYPIPIVPPSPGTINGEIEFRLRYGRPGFLKYELAGHKQVVVRFNEAGDPDAATWNDLIP